MAETGDSTANEPNLQNCHEPKLTGEDSAKEDPLLCVDVDHESQLNKEEGSLEGHPENSQISKLGESSEKEGLEQIPEAAETPKIASENYIDQKSEIDSQNGHETKSDDASFENEDQQVPDNIKRANIEEKEEKITEPTSESENQESLHLEIVEQSTEETEINSQVNETTESDMYTGSSMTGDTTSQMITARENNSEERESNTVLVEVSATNTEETLQSTENEGVSEANTVAEKSTENGGTSSFDLSLVHAGAETNSSSIVGEGLQIKDYEMPPVPEISDSSQASENIDNSSFLNISEATGSSTSDQSATSFGVLTTNDDSASNVCEKSDSNLPYLESASLPSNSEVSSSSALDVAENMSESSKGTNLELSAERFAAMEESSTASVDQPRDVDSCSTDFESCSYLEEPMVPNSGVSTNPSENQVLPSDQSKYETEDSRNAVSSGPCMSSSVNLTTESFTEATSDDFNSNDHSKSEASFAVSTATEDANSNISNGAIEKVNGAAGDLEEMPYNEEDTRKVNELYKQIKFQNEVQIKDIEDANVNDIEPTNENENVEDENDVVVSDVRDADIQSQLLKRTESCLTDVTMSNLSTCVNYSASDAGDVDDLLANESELSNDAIVQDVESGLSGRSEGDVEQPRMDPVKDTNSSDNQEQTETDQAQGDVDRADVSNKEEETTHESPNKDVDLSGGSTLVDSEYVPHHETDEEVADSGDVQDKEVDEQNNNSCNLVGEGNEKESVEPPAWDDILGTGCLRRKILRRGYGEDTKPRKGEVVTVMYSLFTKQEEEGTNPTTLVEETRLDFVLGDGDVIDALDLCVQLMEMNEQCIIESVARFAFGSTGYVPAVDKSELAHDLHAWPNVEVAPNTDVVLHLELLNARELPSDYALYTTEQLLNTLSKKKEKGNFYSRRCEWEKAMGGYNQALKIIQEDENDLKLNDEQLREWRVTFYNNLAFTQLKTELYRQAVISADFALDNDPNNTKAMFRKAKGYYGMGEVRAAIEVLKMAKQLNPSDKEISILMNELLERQKSDKRTEKEVYSKMMQNIKSSSNSSLTKSHLEVNTATNETDLTTGASTVASSRGDPNSRSMLFVAISGLVLGIAMLTAACLSKFK
ncbi:uncharacterized protein LOC142341603 isoform X2 [Convolutriloba macropyga]|uniref:uncharacterized protein LOC142341603 isoform X2 n=1 Tax=Convolutriloba macropyga TaxID=536237 RepID=UPI003F51C947